MTKEEREVFDQPTYVGNLQDAIAKSASSLKELMRLLLLGSGASLFHTRNDLNNVSDAAAVIARIQVVLACMSTWGMEKG